jgi:hypothetical protein
MQTARNLDPPDAAANNSALTRVFESLYPGREPLYVRSALDKQLSGREPLGGIFVFRVEGKMPHWHFITDGFSDPARRLAEEDDLSGCGFELTFRLRITRGADGRTDEDPPEWVFGFLQNLARYVFSTGNLFDEGHYLDLHGPSLPNARKRLAAIAISRDKDLPESHLPSGAVNFLQIFGLTSDEFRAVRAWDTLGFFELIRTVNPQLVTQLGRHSYLRTPMIKAKIEEGKRREGSSTDFLFVASARWEINEQGPGPHLTLYLGANGIVDLREFIPGRVPLGRYLAVVAGNSIVRFEPTAHPSWYVRGDTLVLRLSPRGAITLATSLRPKVGVYKVPDLPDARIIIEQSEIRDELGNVVEIVG